MTSEKKNIGVAGIGNLLLQDEGFGVHVVQYLQNNYDFPENVDIQDIGTAGIYMAPMLETCDPILVIDVVDIQGEPGSFHFYSWDDVKAGSFQQKMSPHQLGMLEILEICKLRGESPGKVEFYTIIPHQLTETIELSEVASARMLEVADMILNRLADLGVRVSRKGE